MTAETHQDFTREFPEMKDAIHHLKASDMHFKRLFDEYEIVAKELDRRGRQISDEHAEELKKLRLELKDKLYKILADSKKVSTGTGSCCSG